MKIQLQGFTFIMMASIGFGAMGTIAIFAYQQGIDSNTLLFFRFGLAAIALWLIIAIKKISFKVKSKELFILIVLGAVGYSCMSTLLFKSFQIISPAMAVLVFYTYPVMVMILSFLFHLERVTKGKVISLLLAGVGLLLVLQTSTDIKMIGIFYSFLAAIIYAIFILISKNRLGENSLVNSAYISLFTSMTLLMVGYGNHHIHINFSFTAWVIMILLAVVSTILPFLFFFEGLKRIGASKASIISIVEPVFAVFLSNTIFDQHLTILQWIGLLVVILAIIGLNIPFISITPKSTAALCLKNNYNGVNE
ncbi:DMT family transporter [Neobacillus sp. D3-1R]|uniref:DMT family transporter n=1 Tax=Neobacillus sp. D3-1R TaxID=3445778 RepID=UPI003FA04CC4